MSLDNQTILYTMWIRLIRSLKSLNRCENKRRTNYSTEVLLSRDQESDSRQCGAVFFRYFLRLQIYLYKLILLYVYLYYIIYICIGQLFTRIRQDKSVIQVGIENENYIQTRKRKDKNVSYHNSSVLFLLPYKMFCVQRWRRRTFKGAISRLACSVKYQL